MKLIFCMLIKIKVFFKLKLSFLMTLAKHDQSMELWNVLILVCAYTSQPWQYSRLYANRRLLQIINFS